jgi:hypothetical protein
MKRTRTTPPPKAPRQLMIALDSPAIEGLETEQQAEAIGLLAQLLLEACGVAGREDDDEDV